ncbi:OmpA family protein [Novosphingobium sp.]|uniref:OmpA family protein n=1 Tax=Novosphingobium sp. TaxID=1874826 RepID=UPI002734ECFD|nr:OmpA family protein [Novosphingobium sp.]MDP3908218.1 OmpA family protein [Novosphingobium sp.]
MAAPAELTEYEQSLACKFSQTCDVADSAADTGDDGSQVVGDEAPFTVFAGKGAAAPAPAKRAASVAATGSGSGPRLYSGGAARSAASGKVAVSTARMTAKTRSAPTSARKNAAEMQVLFGNDSATLNQSGMSEVRAWANLFKSGQFASMRIRIEGHTNAVGNRDHNLSLSQRRARSVLDYMVAQGIPAERIEAVGYGFDRPKSPNPRDAQNRRVEIVKAD